MWQEWKQQLNHKKHDEKEWLTLPVHSWHLTACVQQHYADDIASGILILEGPDLQTRPSMSFRTMRPLTPENAPFIKLPVAIWMTSEMRSLQAKSIHMGPRISQLIK
ncbi:IucA/IucC family protein [Candidatus Hamiltonella endosymbiont of Tuberolachnus salignus]|uniref:IucA/IucC family protein n=1 Tax=Candidatus Williamhamiltonella endosymbiont of Tuberolachnus salignus TaxID=3077954 RepID=UPI0030CFDAA9